MYGLTSGPGPIDASLTSWLSPSHVLGGVVLGLFLVLHVVIVRYVVRPMDGLDRFAAPRGRSGRRRSIGGSHAKHRASRDAGNSPSSRARLVHPAKSIQEVALQPPMATPNRVPRP